jgi:hypothetical protein
MLCAAILLLHEWLPLWQAFGLAGVVVLLLGLATWAITRPAPGLNSA